MRAGLECIAYQIMDVVEAMSQDAGIGVNELRVDGGPTKNEYLMQFQSDILGAVVKVPETEELSGIGAAYAAGIALGVWDQEIFGGLEGREYVPGMNGEARLSKSGGWKEAVKRVISRERE